MSRIDSRLMKAEIVLGARRECSCRPAVYYPGEEQPSSICPKCDGHRVIIGVVYESPQFPNYDEAERMPLGEVSNAAGRNRHE